MIVHTRCLQKLISSLLRIAICIACFFVVSVIIAVTSPAEDSNGIIEVAVSSESLPERQQAFTQALETLFIKSSNKPEITNEALVKAKLEQPGIYVKRYSYIRRTINAGQTELFLQIGFDIGAIEKFLQSLPSSDQQAVTMSQVNKVIIRIMPIDGVYQYHEVAKYVKSLSKSITRVELRGINSLSVELAIDVPGGRQTLVEILSKQSKLIPNVALTSPPGIDLDYTWIVTHEEKSPSANP